MNQSQMTVSITCTTTLDEIVQHINHFLYHINASLSEVKCRRVDRQVVLSVEDKGAMHFLMEI